MEDAVKYQLVDTAVDSKPSHSIYTAPSIIIDPRGQLCHPQGPVNSPARVALAVYTPRQATGNKKVYMIQQKIPESREKNDGEETL